MKDSISRNTVLSILEKIEHPEIALSLSELGMIIDAAVEHDQVHVAIAVPKIEIPTAVYKAITDLIVNALQKPGITVRPQFFEMTVENRERFFALAKANWKSSR
ncbi:MAG: DUF59 domain-containing protein [Calditrichaceae bacterium]|nr:DUF59 domain-containing protein [Calditrichaceae bacterium]